MLAVNIHCAMYDMMLCFRQIWDLSTNDVFIAQLPGGSGDDSAIGGCCLPGKYEWKHHIYIICSNTIRLVGVNLPDSKVNMSYILPRFYCLVINCVENE